MSVSLAFGWSFWFIGCCRCVGVIRTVLKIYGQQVKQQTPPPAPFSSALDSWRKKVGGPGRRQVQNDMEGAYLTSHISQMDSMYIYKYLSLQCACALRLDRQMKQWNTAWWSRSNSFLWSRSNSIALVRYERVIFIRSRLIRNPILHTMARAAVQLHVKCLNCRLTLSIVEYTSCTPGYKLSQSILKYDKHLFPPVT